MSNLPFPHLSDSSASSPSSNSVSDISDCSSVSYINLSHSGNSTFSSAPRENDCSSVRCINLSPAGNSTSSSVPDESVCSTEYYISLSPSVNSVLDESYGTFERNSNLSASGNLTSNSVPDESDWTFERNLSSSGTLTDTSMEDANSLNNSIICAKRLHSTAEQNLDPLTENNANHPSVIDTSDPAKLTSDIRTPVSATFEQKLDSSSPIKSSTPKSTSWANAETTFSDLGSMSGYDTSSFFERGNLIPILGPLKRPNHFDDTLQPRKKRRLSWNWEVISNK